MNQLPLQNTWLGALITLEVAAQFAWLSAMAIALRAMTPRQCRR